MLHRMGSSVSSRRIRPNVSVDGCTHDLTDYSYAEMDKETKNKISHRYRALDKLRAHLQAKKE